MEDSSIVVVQLLVGSLRFTIRTAFNRFSTLNHTMPSGVARNR